MLFSLKQEAPASIGGSTFTVDSEEYTIKPGDSKTKCDMVNHPSHYKLKNGLEAIDVIKAMLTEEEFIGFCKGNALKYQFRAGKKDQAKTTEDYKKAMFYLKEIIK